MVDTVVSSVERRMTAILRPGTVRNLIIWNRKRTIITRGSTPHHGLMRGGLIRKVHLNSRRSAQSRVGNLVNPSMTICVHQQSLAPLLRNVPSQHTVFWPSNHNSHEAAMKHAKPRARELAAYCIRFHSYSFQVTITFMLADLPPPDI